MVRPVIGEPANLTAPRPVSLARIATPTRYGVTRSDGTITISERGDHMKKGMGRGAAILALSSAASVALTLGPSLAAANAFDDKNDGGIGNKDNCVGNKDGKDGKDDWDIFGDKDKDKDVAKDGKDGKDGKDLNEDKQVRADDINKDKDDDWFNWDDKDKDKNKDGKDCPVGGIVAGVGVGVVGGGVGGGVAAGGGGMADPSSSPMIPLAGAAFGALLIGAGVARRRAQGAA